MRFPDEIVVAHYAPTVRALLVQALEKRGLNQTAIADLVGVSQSAVSKYQSGKLAPHPNLAREPRLVATVERAADSLATGGMAPLDVLAVFMDLLREFENRGPICVLHEQEMPALRGLGCDLCVRGERAEFLEEQQVLARVRRAVQTLQATDGLAPFIPHVGTNVAEALSTAEDVTGVAAVPGGLFEMRGTVRAPGPPEFGVSKHVAEIALAVKSADSAKRAALNLATDDRLLAAAAEEGLAALAVPPGVERDPTMLKRSLPPRVPDLVHHAGDFGVEPQTYVLAATAPEAAEVVQRLVERTREALQPSN